MSHNKHDTTTRLDKFLYTQKHVASREKASDLILAGSVFVNGLVVKKPGKIVSFSDTIQLKTQDNAYVSRAGAKLEKALEHFTIDVKDFIAMDVGASTGGFTDCLCQKGCKKIYAIDVGTDQLHESLKYDKRIISIENTNFRYLEKNIIVDDIDIITVDVSFISLKKIISKILEFSSYNTVIILLFKPQFEVGKKHLHKGSVKDIEEVRHSFFSLVELAATVGLQYIDAVASPIMGKKKNNQEYLSLWRKCHLSNQKNGVGDKLSIDKIFE